MPDESIELRTKLDNLTLRKEIDIADYYARLRQSEEVIFSYKGFISNDSLETILTLTEEKLNEVEPSIKIQRRVNVIAVEILQNIFHHFELDPDDDIVKQHFHNTIIFLLGKNDDGYYVFAGNFLPKVKMDFLKEKIDDINKLSPDKLKMRYREVLSNGDFSKQGGAGLGIIDIARKSGQKLEYSFSEVENNFSFFSLKVNVPFK